MKRRADKERSGQKHGSATILMLLTNAYDPDPRVRQEALALTGMGCNVRVLAWDRDSKAPASECTEGVQIERVYVASTHGRGSTQLFFYAWLYLKMFWRGLRTSFDAVHCHDLDTLPLGFVLGKLKRKPVVYDAHESFPDMVGGSVHPAICRGLTWLEDLLIRRVGLLITVGEKLRAHFAARGARRSVVVGNWKRIADFTRTQEERNAVRHRLGIPDRALVVVCITNLLHDRKLEEFLGAVDASPDVYAIIGGTGALRSLVEERAARNPRLVYVGFVHGREIADYTCAADAVYYGFDDRNPNAQYSAPNKLFEALAAGRPLITGNFGEIADVVRKFSCGVVLSEYSVSRVRDAFDALRDPIIRNTMGANAREAAQTSMNWSCAEEVLYHAYSALVRSALKKPGSLQMKSGKAASAIRAVARA